MAWFIFSSSVFGFGFACAGGLGFTVFCLRIDLVENNFMTLIVMDEYERDYRDGLLLFDGDEKKASEYANGIVVDKGQAALIGLGGLFGAPLLPESAIIGGSLSGAINAGMQYTLNDDGSINWTDVGIATGIGGITGGLGTGFWGTVGWNTAGGATSNALKGEDPATGALSGALSSGFGYMGGKLLQGPLQKLFNPVSKQYEWIPTGVWTITKPAPQSSIPTWTGSAADAAASEWMNKVIDERLKGNNNEIK